VCVLLSGDREAALTKFVFCLLPLTLTEWHDLPKMGDQTLSVVEKAQDCACQYLPLCLSYLDLTALGTDLTAAAGLCTVHIVAGRLSDDVDDTVMVAGSEACLSVFVFAAAVRSAAAQDISGVREVYGDRTARLPRVKCKK
jgi:hypothetical protein